jgi:putative MATE family efflux protein
MISQLLQTAYQLTDTFWVGRLGANAIASVSISFPVLFAIIAWGGGLTMAGAILIAQYKGRGDDVAVNHIAGQTLIGVTLVSLILTVVGYFLSPVLIKMMGVEPAVLEDAVSYLKISFLGLIFVFIYFVFQSALRGIGDVKTPMYIVLATVLLNLVLDPLFIFGWGSIPAMGVSGAALATILTQGISALAGLVILFSGKRGINLNLKGLKFDFPLLKKMFMLGLPASFGNSLHAVGMTFMTFLVASFGTIATAAYGIGGRMLSFVIIPSIGISMATSTLVGQNIGAKKVDRAEEIAKISSLAAFFFLTIVGILMFIFAEDLSSFFLPGEVETIGMAVTFLKLMALTFGFIGIQMVIEGAFRGAGCTGVAMMLALIALWGLQFPIAYILSKYAGLGELGIWISIPVSSVLGCIISVIWFSRGSWKRKKLTEEIKISEKIIEEAVIEEGIN